MVLGEHGPYLASAPLPCTPAHSACAGVYTVFAGTTPVFTGLSGDKIQFQVKP